MFRWPGIHLLEIRRRLPPRDGLNSNHTNPHPLSPVTDLSVVLLSAAIARSPISSCRFSLGTGSCLSNSCGPFKAVNQSAQDQEAVNQAPQVLFSTSAHARDRGRP